MLLDRAAVRGERPRRSRAGSPLVGEVEGEGGVRALVAELCRADLIAAITGVEAAVVALFVGVNHTVTTDGECGGGKAREGEERNKSSCRHSVLQLNGREAEG